MCQFLLAMLASRSPAKHSTASDQESIGQNNFRDTCQHIPHPTRNADIKKYAAQKV
jgi:hypothetical protein